MIDGQTGRFKGWPANRGIWSWDNGRELLVTYIDSRWEPQWSHNSGGPSQTLGARSTDGGHTWHVEGPVDFGNSVRAFPGALDFDHSDFAMFVEDGQYSVSYDRGRSWQGPYRIHNIVDHAALAGMRLTSRNCYTVLGRHSVRCYLSAQDPSAEHASRSDKTFVVESHDGGLTFQFIAWVVAPETNNYRAVMPSVAHGKGGEIMVAVRCRNPYDILEPCWVDAYVSGDEGKSWSFRSRIAETGYWNGNPPALTTFRDGRILCCYGNRTTRQMLARETHDNGRTWSEEIVLHDNAWEADLGYPKMVRNHLDQAVATYYVATREHPHSFIEAAIISG